MLIRPWRHGVLDTSGRIPPRNRIGWKPIPPLLLLTLAISLWTATGKSRECTEPVEVGPAYTAALERAIATTLEGSPISKLDPDLTIAVLPIDHDLQERAYDLLRIELARADVPVFDRMDSEWEQLLGEIEWGQVRGDIMDPATVQEFGRIQGVSALLYGRILDVRAHEDATVSMRLHLHISVVETGQHVWGGRAIGRSSGTPPVPLWVAHGRLLSISGGGLILLLLIIAFIHRATRPL
ncbi:hypothetical protein ACFL6M_06325 [Candidatus Eisenbacteria bacterium]|uniref:Uncharacterized protein n=1 Tax=Eiseniibacteriota bacterium TaxID=2212470 RepID=A0ABV6YLZ6_UNCEI